MRRIVLGFVFLTAACVNQKTGAAKAQETAQEHNLNTKFGRMEVAMESVDPKFRDEFLRHHKGWGGQVRVADSELAGMRMLAKDEAQVSVRVAWYNQDEQELRLTNVKQIWRDHKGDWKLEGEERVDGDLGLLGEHVERPPSGPRENMQFPTIRIGSN